MKKKIIKNKRHRIWIWRKKIRIMIFIKDLFGWGVEGVDPTRLAEHIFHLHKSASFWSCSYEIWPTSTLLYSFLSGWPCWPWVWPFDLLICFRSYSSQIWPTYTFLHSNLNDWPRWPWSCPWVLPFDLLSYFLCYSNVIWTICWVLYNNFSGCS